MTNTHYKNFSTITYPRQGLLNLKRGSFENFCDYNGRIMILGYGSIGEGTLPLILRHINIPLENIFIVTAPDREKEARKAAQRYGVNVDILAMTGNNYEQIMKKYLSKGDFCLNVSVDVSSLDLIKWCNKNQVLYLDTVIEPWKGFYTNAKLPASERSNYALREKLLKLKSQLGSDGPTAVSCHGANPGMVSHFVKQALLNIAADTGLNIDEEPVSQAQWAKLAYDLGVKVIHIAERDTQISSIPKKKNEFVNTWSIDGFISEGCQPAELGFGTHEKNLPFDGERHTYGKQSAIFLNQPGCITKVRSWTPMEKSYHGYLITHNEAITISDYFTYMENSKVLYRPTCHYVYHPCNDAILSLLEFNGNNFVEQEHQRILNKDIISGVDELGVLLCGHKKNAYWFGSQLDIHSTREMVEDNQATSLQVCSSVWAGLIWAIKNPKRGITECEEMDYKFIMDLILPYISPVIGEYSDWNPIQGRNILFPEDIDTSDPWQFQNTRVMEMNRKILTKN